MNWLLFFHITAMLAWCASLLYLPVFLSSTSAQKNSLVVDDKKISKMMFTLILTPAALLTIVSGTLVFISMKTSAFWLIFKLTLVTGLVICHAFNGWLILKKGYLNEKTLRRCCMLANALSISLMSAIFWIVLAKPSLGGLI